MRIRSHASFTLVEIMIVVAIISLLAAIAIPNMVRARTVAQQKTCIVTLRQLEAAKQLGALKIDSRERPYPPTVISSGRRCT